jgi:hypothetical protein
MILAEANSTSNGVRVLVNQAQAPWLRFGTTRYGFVWLGVSEG